MNDKIITIGKRNPNLPFHPAVRAGDFIYVSGQVAKDENGNMSQRQHRGGDALDHREHPPHPASWTART